MAEQRRPISLAVFEDDGGIPASTSAVMDVIMTLPREQRARHALALSARLVEFAAFEAAGQLPSGCVGALIDCSAGLDRTSNDLQPLAAASPQAPSIRIQ